MVFFWNIDQTLVNSLHGLMNCEKGGLDCVLLQHSIKYVSILHTCNTYFVMHWSILFIQECPVNVRFY